MQLWKLALSLALLTGAAPLTSAQSPKKPRLPVADPVEQAPTPTPAPTNPFLSPDPTIVPGKWKIEYKWVGKTTQVWNFAVGDPVHEVDSWGLDGSQTAVGGPLYALPPGYTGNEPPTSRTFDSAGTVTVTCSWVADTSSYTVPPPNPKPVTAPTVLRLLEIP